MPNVSTIFTTALVSLAVASWLVMAPSNIGGPVDYMITDGISMQPYMNRGDLAVVRIGHAGETGDVMAYLNPLTKQRVLHRVIGVSDEHTILKGDNNTWVDSFQPTDDELIGTLWFRIPHAGKVVSWLQSPLHAGILVGLGTVMNSLMGRRSRKRTWHGASGSREGSGRMRRILFIASGAAGQNTLSIMLVVAIFASAASVVVWRMPSEKTEVVQREYEHRGIFGYSAETVIPAPTSPPIFVEDEPSSAEPDLGTLALDPTVRAFLDVPVTTGDPILINVNPRVNFTFDYQFDTLIEGEMSGTVRLDAVVSDITGWKRTFLFAPEQAFSGGQAHIEVPDADVAPFLGVFPVYQAITGHAPVYYTASIVAVVTLDAVLEGQVLHHTFEPAVTFRVVPPYEIYVDTIDLRQFETLGLLNITVGESSGSPFDTSQVGTLGYPTTVPNTIPLLGFDLSVSLLRVATATAGGLALLILLTVLFLQRMGSHQGEASDDEALHGKGVVLLDDDQRGNAHTPTTYVARIADLIRISDHNGSPVLCQRLNGDSVYSVREGEHLYAYVSRSDS